MSTVGTASTVITGIAALGGVAGIASLGKVFVDRTKIRADAVAEIAKTSVGMLHPLHEEIERLSTKLRAAETELDDLRRQMRQLSGQNAEAEMLRDKWRVSEQARELLYDELSEKNRLLGERDRLIAKLRANTASGDD